VLDGKRAESRPMEEWAISAGRVLTRIIPFTKKYSPIKAETVAAAMIAAVFKEDAKSFNIYESLEIFELAGSSVASG